MATHDMYLLRHIRSDVTVYYTGANWTQHLNEAAYFINRLSASKTADVLGCCTVILSMLDATDEPAPSDDPTRSFVVPGHVNDQLNGAAIQRYLRSLKIPFYSSGGSLVCSTTLAYLDITMDLVRMVGIPAGTRWNNMSLNT